MIATNDPPACSRHFLSSTPCPAPHAVPAFLRTPDFERSQWLSTTLDILWPHINRAADLIVDRNVETTIVRGIVTWRDIDVSI